MGTIRPPKWAVFYDFHTAPAVHDVGAKFDADRFADELAAAGVDFTVFHARCNMGFAYYNTQLGVRHPGLNYDLFGKIVEACHRRQIRISAYFNLGLSHEEGIQHREWLALSPEGYVYHPRRMDHWVRRMCYNTGYADHVIAMMQEVLDRHQVDGFFCDCFSVHPCQGVECVREMKRTGLDPLDKAAVETFALQSRNRLAERISRTLLAKKTDLLLYFNGVPFTTQRDWATYYEYECLPTGGWGYELLPAYCRYLRTLGKPVLNMSGRFHLSWGDFGGIRTEPSLEYDCIQGLANGLHTTIGDHQHPRGDLNRPVFELIKSIYGRLHKLQPWLESAQVQAEAAVLAPNRGSAGAQLGPEVLGATRLLSELKLQFDVITAGSQEKDYELLILPDEPLADEELIEKVRRHLTAGKPILTTARAGLDVDKKAFLFPELGVSLIGLDTEPEVDPGVGLNQMTPPAPAFFVAEPAFAAGLPDMPNNCYLAGVRVRAEPGTETLARIVEPYFPRRWDGEHHLVYIPPERETAAPAVTCRGNRAYVTHPIFGGYHQTASVPFKHLVNNLLARLLSEPLIKAETLPSYARITVTAQANRRMVYILAYLPERRGASVDMIEEPLELRDVRFSLRRDGKNVTRVYLAPSGETLTYESRGDYLEVLVPQVRGWAVVVFEE